MGKPGPPGALDVIRTKVTGAFATIGERASREHFGTLTQACQLPLYWKTPLYLAACADKGSCTLEQFMTFWATYDINTLPFIQKTLMMFPLQYVNDVPR